MAITTVVLDIDGTLLDSNDAHASAWREALRTVGVEVDLQRLREWIGMGGDQLLAQLGLSDETEPGRTAAERKQAIFRQRLLPVVQPFSGTRALLERMAEEGLRRVVATSAGRDELRDLLERAGVDDLVHPAASGDSVDHSKPAPDVVSAALERAGAIRGEAVMLGDTPYDLQAASRAGIQMIALRCGGWTFDDGGPIAVYDDPADLLRHWDASPLRTATVAPGR